MYILGILMFASGELDIRKSFLELDMPVEVVRVKNLFPPVNLDAGFLTSLQSFISSSWNGGVDGGEERRTFTSAIV